MPYTIAQKILMKHACGIEQEKGLPEYILANVDLAFGNDITAPIAIEEFKKAGFTEVFDRKKIALIPDHFTPSKDIKSANQCKTLADFAVEQKIEHYYEVGRMGIEHALLPEKGLVVPGDLVIGADSHTCTYGALGAYASGVGSTDLAVAMYSGKCWFRVPQTIKFVYKGKLQKWVSGKDIILFTIGQIGVDGALNSVMEFSGEVIGKISMDERFTMCNMAIEAGARAGLIEADKKTMNYVRKTGQKRKFEIFKSDAGAKYKDIKEYDLSKMEPQVSLPHLPSNAKPVSEVKNVFIDQVVIGSCTNGRMYDLRAAAGILRGKKVNSRVRLIIIPATQKIYLEAIREGLVEIFVKAGGIFSTPTCGPCIGGHMGVLAEGERALATTNRNFIGRMGSPKSEVYLSGPYVAAASAVAGKIVQPDEI